MTPELAIKTRIAQIKASGQVAPPNTWIGSSSIKKNGKRYTYYRLMKAIPSTPTQENPKPSPKTKMVQYLGSEDSKVYKEMKEAIARRNEIQRLLRNLQTLEKPVSAGKQTKQPALTSLVMELMEQVKQLQEQIEWVKTQLNQGLADNRS